MDKNNDIQVNKVSKWEAAPKDMGALFTYIDLVIGMACCLLHEIHDNLYDLMDKILDDYNELEAKYQEACDKISQYEEENRILREQRKELVGDNDILRRERNRHIDLLDKLRLALEDKGIYCEWSEAALERRLYGKNKLFDELREHYEEELRIREKEKDEKDKLIEKLNSRIKELKLRTNMIYGCYGLNPLGDLNEKIKTLKKENEELKAKNRSLQIRMNVVYGSYKSTDNALKRMVNKVTEFEKENKELKDTLAKDRELGKYVGKCVADSIQEGWKNGAYELHPYTRFDIHVAETKNMSTSFDRYSIPNVVVAFNNTQTEMERDTAQHEYEELDRKFKELEKENKELKDTLAMCERDASTARSLCHNIAYNAEQAGNKALWFNDVHEEE